MLKKGIYEKIIDTKISQALEEAEKKDLVGIKDKMDDAESSGVLANYLANVIRKELEDRENLQDRVKFINNIFSSCGIEGTEIVDNENLLMEVMTNQRYSLQQQSHSTTIRPYSGFRVSNLFTGGNSKLSLGEEIRRDIATADRISFIISFLRVSGVRLLINELKSFCETEGKKLRIITTTYCGITESKAVQQLAELPNTEIKISYNRDLERLHAKAYIFERNSGMHTAYIGSSNLSKSAQTDGLEWNIRITNEENQHIIKTALATFDMYWNSPNFEDFKEEDLDKINEECQLNDARRDNNEVLLQRYSLLPHQKQILDKLKVERDELGNSKNLIVAATGTGKTVISAFDYLDFRNRKKGENCRLLYVAHREEILKQSMYTYQSVLRDGNFGTLWVGNNKPRREQDYEHLFVSVAMFNSNYNDFFSKFQKGYYAYIVVDEAHHSPANSYKELFSHFTPQIIVGLTATPERMDRQDLFQYFGNHISAEIRLPQALQAGLLTPFQYFCVTDNVDLRNKSLWKGRYITDRLAKKLCSEKRAIHIVNALKKYLADENKCRALCFCVNKEHANFMAEQLEKSGFKAKSLTSDTDQDLREQYAENLQEGELNYLCVVDVFNEGVDLPEVDTVLFLRPTDSLTIFLQQLGRGLRLYPGKTELTVLDFVAQVNRNYDYARKFRALTLHPEKNIEEQVKNGFTILPIGCNIVMEKYARDYVLKNIKNAIYNRNRIIQEIQLYDTLPSLEDFLNSNGQDIGILYSNNRCWTSLKRAAKRISYEDDQITERLTLGMKNLIHHNSVSFLHFVRDFIDENNKDCLKEKNRYAAMLYSILYNVRDSAEFDDYNKIYDALGQIHDEKYHYFKQEISEIVSYLLSHLEITTVPLDNDVLPGIELYGCYSQQEIFILAEGKPRVAQAGVVRVDEHNAIFLFVTLNKSDKDFSPSTQYNDYVIDENHFHWQSQNRDSHNNQGGQRYIQQTINNTKIVLFVRENKRDPYGNTSPFHCFGLVDYVESWGDLPMNVKWRLEQPVMAQYRKVV